MTVGSAGGGASGAVSRTLSDSTKSNHHRTAPSGLTVRWNRLRAGGGENGDIADPPLRIVCHAVEYLRNEGVVRLGKEIVDAAILDVFGKACPNDADIAFRPEQLPGLVDQNPERIGYLPRPRVTPTWG